MRGFFRVVVPALVPLVVAGALAEFVVRQGWVKDYILPAPSQVFAAISEDRADLLQATLSTGTASVVGLLLSFVVGTAIAIVLSASERVRRAFYPYAVFFQTVPIIAIAPVLVIWFGFGQPTVIASAFIVSIFPVIASTLLGLRSTDPALVDLFRLYEAGRIRQMFMLRVPAALPEIFSGLRIAVGLSVIGAIVGEFVAGGGLGGLVDAARTQQRIDKVFAAVLISSILGAALVGVVNLLSSLSLRRWHASESEFRV